MRDRLNAEAANSFQVVDDMNDAEVLIYPYRAASCPEVEEVANEARKRNIGCVFFSWGDADESVNVPYGTVYRHSLFSNRRKDHEQAMAAQVSDPQIELGKKIPLRELSAEPSVGFCGYVSNPLMRTVYRMARRRRKAEGLCLRARVIRALKRTKNLHGNFIMRQSYWAGMRGRFRGRHALGEFRPREDFWNNVINNDYTLCIRGAGNFSYRFYEVLAAGRIPLFINTRCVLPFEDEIDWRKHCVWVEEDQIDSAGEILVDFHARLTPQRFRSIQAANRQLWEHRLSPLAFYQTALGREVPGASVPIPIRDWDTSEVAASAAM
jgi:hypothetical protein